MKLRKIFAAASVFFIAFTCAAPVSVFAAEEYEVRAPHMYAHAYAVMDANTGEVLFGENVDKKIYPASTAKLMSAIVAVESDTPLDTVIKTKGKIVHSSTPGTYCLGMNGGEKYTLSALLNMSLIASAADATDTMAVGLYGSRADFAKKMNEKTAELGLTKTSFDNPVGSDIGGGFKHTYSTAREMSEIARYAMSLETIRKITAKSHYTIKGTGSQSGRQISNTNWFYTQMPYNDNYFTIIGSKTGTTNAAGHVFIATAIDDDGHELICSYFGKESKASTFSSINSLLTYAFKQYKKGNLTLSRGAYNIRYDEDSLAYTRSMDAEIFSQDSSGCVALDETITQEQAAGMIEAVLAPELSGTRINSYFDQVSASSASCDSDYISTALATALPGIEKTAPVKEAIESLPETITIQNAAHLTAVAAHNFSLYEMSFPTYEMRSVQEDNLVPFMSTFEFSD
ncbi:MAG: serine hydrolase [Lachnospiraceae bacterium]|nr:serine hydrolase [Lachnospiraceae bacterium]